MVKRISGLPQKKQKQKSKDKKKKSEEEQVLDDNQIVIINNIQPPAFPADKELRTINLYGDINERVGADVVAALLYLENSSHMEMPEHPDNTEEMPVIVARSIAMLVSNHGGSATDRFSIVDVMDMSKKRPCDIETI